MPTPAPDYHLVFQDGPCAFTVVTITAADVSRGTIVCKGATYGIQPAPGGSVNGFVGYVATGTGTGTIQQFAPDLFAGYENLRRSVVTRLRPAVTTALRYDQLALRALSRRPKVKG